MTSRQAHWQSVYQNKEESEVSWFQERPASSIRLIERTGFDHAARIIDIGGGASRLVDYLLDLGYVDVTVLDVAEAALAKARTRLGSRAENAQWLVTDVTRWRPISVFGIWHDRAVFHFLVEAKDRKAYGAAMAAAVSTGGQAIVGTFALDGPERCSGLPVRRYDTKGLEAEFAPWFHTVETFAEDHVTPAGKTQKFLFCRMQRN